MVDLDLVLSFFRDSILSGTSFIFSFWCLSSLITLRILCWCIHKIIKMFKVF